MSERIEIPSKKDQVSAEEWQLRVDLAAAYRLIAMYGWDDLIFTHISVRIPGPDHQFLINPYGMMFDEITASSLVRIDQEGNKINPDDFDVNPAGFTIHSAVHAVREDAACVMHTHTRAGVAVSAQSEGLLPLSQQSLFPLSNLSYHDYEGVALREDEKARLQADLGTNNFMILRNHGLLTTGSSVADAFLGMYVLQTACEIQIQALSGNRELTPVPAGIVDTIQQQASQATRGLGGKLAWPGLLRKLDRVNPGYEK
ncbi:MULTISPECIES: class II aldolase/adducin family protein [Marinobacter]|uniref:Class II aldolase/adducin family protein n=1 Tax=Marinobacter suaedae TaxID=3057675 RepID=A0ABT8VX59_9GAMM|nr:MULTISPECIES: class II aldolase/adducin family protein [unclassified Marinobacter]MBZ2168695.1 class II aldolase/adducin family protein [Marinobacter sp. F4216]MDO3720573.1 class II aldolase/adducin family protein [Marinobacter sp. chi1]